MEERIICIHCLNEIDPGMSRCPHCGNGTTRSKSLYDFLKRQERRNSLPSPEMVARRANVYPSAARKILSAYYPNTNDAFGEKNLPELNAIISKIQVEKLFGYLNYTIDFHDDTSIIIAPNGFGKTTMFHFINFVLNPDIYVYMKHIRGVPYKTFSVTLNNGVVLTLTNGDEDGVFTFSASNVEQPKEITIPFSDDNTEAYYRNRDESDYYAEKLVGINKMMDLLKEAGVSSQIFFIKTSRAFAQPEKIVINRSVGSGSVDEEDLIDPIVGCNDELLRYMSECRNEYQRQVEKVKNALPSLFLATSEPSMSLSEFRTEWDQYRESLNELVKFGLLEEQTGLDFVNNISQSDYQDMIMGKGAFLSIYVSQYKETLEPFKDLWLKMSIFKDIIDERNKGTGKHIEYCRDGILYCNGDKPIKLECLSSGEKNDFIMFFDLVFRTRKGTIILIDEPEISLHINWQERFIDNIAKHYLKRHAKLLFLLTHQISSQLMMICLRTWM